MRKFQVSALFCIMIITASASAALPAVYGTKGYDTEGYDEAHAWEIDSAETLAKIRDDINRYSSNIPYGAHFRFTKDIDLTGYQDWNPININRTQNFIFDGGDHRIAVRIIRSGTIYAGLFGLVESGTIKNLSVSGSIQVHGMYNSIDAILYRNTTVYAGGIAAYLRGGRIENCSFDGRIFAAGNTGRAFAGGITAYAGDDTISIVNCKAGSISQTAIIATGDDSYAGRISAGGIVGYFNDKRRTGKITGCYSSVRLGNAPNNGMIYGYRSGNSGTVSGNTEVITD